jgi:hypothetical protein
MLESHNSTAFARDAHENHHAGRQFSLSLGLALIEASEDVLSAAKRFLCSVPGTDAHTASHLQFTERWAVDGQPCPEAGSARLADPRESVEYESEW